MRGKHTRKEYKEGNERKEMRRRNRRKEMREVGIEGRK